MEHIGLDLHKNQSQLCIMTKSGKLIEKRIRTDRRHLQEELGRYQHARILLEASTKSEWVARCIEEIGHEVIVGDPNFAPMYAQRSRRIKSDRRDSRALMEASRLGAYRPAYRVSDEQRLMRAQLCVREALVRQRSSQISLVRAMLRQNGFRMASGTSATFSKRVLAVNLPSQIEAIITPVLEIMEQLGQQISMLNKKIGQLAKQDPLLRRLTTMPGVGPITSAAFVATIDRVDRFANAHSLESYLGLVPTEFSSGEKQYKGRITKAGNRRLRCLLVEAAWAILTHNNPKVASLKLWATGIALRRGKRIAAVALARRIAGILFAMWRDGTEYQPRTKTL